MRDGALGLDAQPFLRDAADFERLRGRATGEVALQTRGRTLRLDPRDPAKVAINWTVCCVAEKHPKGDNDWQRTVAKHRGYFGVDGSGTALTSTSA